MASKKQLAWRKKFAKMSKAGKFKKKQARSKSWDNPKSIGAKKSKFDKTGKKKDMVAGVDYYKDMRDLLGTAKKPKSKITQKLKKEMRY
jgi:hypothetical protein